MSGIAHEIKCCAKRAYWLAGAEIVNPDYVESYWGIKEDLFKACTNWEHCYGQYPKAMQKDLQECHDNLQECWCKICEAGLN